MTLRPLSRLPRIALILLFAASIATCTTVQTTKSGVIGLDRTQRMSPLVPAEQLNQGARVAYAEVLQGAQNEGQLNSDAALTARVRQIAERIIPQVSAFREDALQWEWQVNVIESEQLNAWCMPGGKIAFYSGIIEQLQLTDAEIAAIMGHEIAHALREHSRERSSEQALTGLVIGAGAVAIGAGSAAVDMTQMAYQTVFGLRHSRAHETEADRVGIELSARAGYDPQAAVTLWQKMGAASGGKSGPEFLSTHPSPDTRVKDLRKYGAIVQPLYLQAR